MKKLILLLILSVGLTSISYADYFDDFTDEGICLWRKQSPENPSYSSQAKKRGLNCSGGNLIGRTNATLEDVVDNAYEKLSNVKESAPIKDVCSEVIKKRVIAEEYVSESKSFSELKKYVVRIALEDAIQQVTGADVRNFSSLSLSSNNGVESEKFSEASTSKTKGTIDSYDIINTEVLDLGGAKVLSVEVEAYVCVKDNALSKDVLLVGDFTYQNSRYPALRSAAESIFSRQTKSFELGYGNPNTSYHDIIITGRIDNITSEIIVDKKAMDLARQRAQKQKDDAASSAAFISILGAVSNNNGNSSAFFNNLNNSQYNNQYQTEIRIPQITIGIVKVFVTVNANHKTINRTYTATAVSQAEVSPALLRSNTSNYDVNALTIEAIKKASKDLYVQLNN
jgi:hypothetical protein